MSIVRLLTLSLVIVACSADANDSPTSSAPPAQRTSGYAAVKSWHAERLRRPLSGSERVEALCEVIRRGPYGERGLTRMFKSFEGAYSLDPRIPGVETTARLVSSENANLRKGHARTLMYSQQVNMHPEFKLTAVNQRRNGPDGRMISDDDICWEHRRTGQKGYIEAKDVSPASQRASLTDLKRQMDKMRAEAINKGRVPIWANRREVIPELIEYGRKVGIPVHGNVVTGRRTLKPGETQMSALLGQQHKALVRRASQMASGASNVGFGLWLTASSLLEGYHELNQVLGPHPQGSVLRIVQHATNAIGGSAMTTHGVTQILSQRLGSSARLVAISRWAGRVAWPLVIVGEGISVARWMRGEISNREFAIEQAQFGGGLSGAAIGGVVGFLVAGPVGAFVGTVVGGIGGGYGGGIATESWLDRMEAREVVLVEEAVRRAYGS